MPLHVAMFLPTTLQYGTLLVPRTSLGHLSKIISTRRTDLFKINFSMKLMIRQSWQFYEYFLFPSNNYFKKKSRHKKLIVLPQAEAKESYHTFMYFPWPPLEAVLSISTFHFFLISNFRRVLYVVCFLLGNSLASEFYMPTFRNTLFHLHRQVGK